MKSGGILKHAAGALLLAVLLYAGGYSLDQHLRTRRGPWEIEFSTGASGEPVIGINQRGLGIRDVRIVLEGRSATNPTGTIAFDVPEKAPPAGALVFEDLTYLPGTVTLRLYGHEIEFLPRTLYLNRKAHPWNSGEIIHLDPAEALSLTNIPSRY